MATLPIPHLDRLCRLVVLGLCLAAATAAVPPPSGPAAFVLRRAARHDVLLLGTRHRQPAILAFVADLLPGLRAAGVTHIGLEIGSDQQRRLDACLATGRGWSKLALHPQIDCAAYRRLLAAVGRNGLAALALDRPAAAAGPGSRDRYMAARLADLFHRRPAARVAVVVGNLHTLKRFPWLSPAVTDTGIRPTLVALRPDLAVCSIAQWNGPEPLAPGASRPLALAGADLSGTPAFLGPAALAPLSAAAAVDAIILHESTGSLRREKNRDRTPLPFKPRSARSRPPPSRERADGRRTAAG